MKYACTEPTEQKTHLPSLKIQTKILFGWSQPHFLPWLTMAACGCMNKCYAKAMNIQYIYIVNGQLASNIQLMIGYDCYKTIDTQHHGAAP